MRSLLLPLLLMLAACAGPDGPSPSPALDAPSLAPFAAKTQVLERRSERWQTELVGTVVARREATIQAKLAGTIIELPLHLGSSVAANELLLRIDAQEVQAQLRRAETQAVQAEREKERFATLLADGAIPPREYENVATEAGVAAAAVAEARAMLAYTSIQAPFAGVITAKQAEVGDLAMPGVPLLKLADPQALRLEVAVPEHMAAGLSLGEQLSVHSDAIRLQAPIAEIAPTADPLSRTVMVKLDLPADSNLRIGRFCRVAVPGAASETLRIPAAALHRRGQLDIVFIAADKQARMRLVRPGRKHADTVEILSGLEAGETIIINPSPTLVDGQAIE